MDNSAPQHDSTADQAATEPARPAGDGTPARERFSLSFQVPDLKLTSNKQSQLREVLAKVARDAMKQIGKEMQYCKLGMRIHAQYAERGVSAHRLDRLANIVVPAFERSIYPIGNKVQQLVITKAPGECDGIAISIWEIEE